MTLVVKRDNFAITLDHQNVIIIYSLDLFKERGREPKSEPWCGFLSGFHAFCIHARLSFVDRKKPPINSYFTLAKKDTLCHLRDISLSPRVHHFRLSLRFLEKIGSIVYLTYLGHCFQNSLMGFLLDLSNIAKLLAGH